MIRTFLIDASMLGYFWLEDAYATIYTINNFAIPVLANRTPFEVLFNRTPDYSFLKPFGYACFPNFMTSSANKLHPRSVQCVFLGYTTNYKGYHCLDPVSGKVYVNRHVRFYENQYPFPHLSSKYPHISPTYVFCLKEILTLTLHVSQPDFESIGPPLVANPHPSSAFIALSVTNGLSLTPHTSRPGLEPYTNCHMSAPPPC